RCGHGRRVRLMRSFLDTKVLACLFDAGAAAKRAAARSLVEQEIGAGRGLLSAQVLVEFHVALTRQVEPPLEPEVAAEALRALAELAVLPVDRELVLAAAARSRSERLTLRDALIVEAALAGGCTTLYTEELEDGRRIGELVVVNPFGR
ncbi:MAG: PIN domain-containing protein, partial [Longimicrobiales bacterium]